MRISSRFVDFSLTMCQFSRTHHEEVVNMSWVDWCGKWEDVEGQENFPVSAGFEPSMTFCHGNNGFLSEVRKVAI